MKNCKKKKKIIKNFGPFCNFIFIIFFFFQLDTVDALQKEYFGNEKTPDSTPCIANLLVDHTNPALGTVQQWVGLSGHTHDR